jgi:hypothetical protein
MQRVCETDFVGLFELGRRRHYDLSKRRELFGQRHTWRIRKDLVNEWLLWKTEEIQEILVMVADRSFEIRANWSIKP